MLKISGTSNGEEGGDTMRTDLNRMADIIPYG